MAKKKVKPENQPKKKTPKVSQGLAVVSLVLNVVLMPGLGTVIGGRTKDGIWQLVLFWVGVLLSIVLIGIPMIIAAWIWGIVSGVRLIQESS